MAQLENIEAIEKRLWKAADTLRSNSELASNEYFLPVMGLIFLRHAYSRYLSVKDDIVAKLPSRGGKTRDLTKEDFSQKSAIFLKPEAQFDYLVALTDADDRAEKIIQAMEAIEADYRNLRDQLPKQEYRTIPNEVLGQLLRGLNPDELKKATGDIFGRIYEYFLTAFADQGAHDGGEFFTPVSLVQMIVNVIEPDHGKIFDPACGSGGMFVQSAHFMEQHQQDPTQLTFYGHEKNRITTRLAKMNLAVHGLEGNIIGGEPAITYYNDPHDGLFGSADFVMANPPFNVDEVDAEKVKNDPRLPFGLPGINKNKKVPNANYLWIQYFYSYLNKSGRAGFVMSSQASSAGREEAKVREQLVKTGHVEAMIDIRGNFFYTRTVPCQLWFFNKAKPAMHRDKVLMIDARNVYRKVTRKIMDFSPEQLQNLSAIVWLYRGQEQRFVELVASYLNEVLTRLSHLHQPSQHQRGLNWFLVKLQRQLRTLDEFTESKAQLIPFMVRQAHHERNQQPTVRPELVKRRDHHEWKQQSTVRPELVEGRDQNCFIDTPILATDELLDLWRQLQSDAQEFKQQANGFAQLSVGAYLATVKQRETALAPLAETSRDLVKSIDHLDKLTANQTQEALEQIKEQLKALEQSIQSVADQSQRADTAQSAALAEQNKLLKEQVKHCNQLRSLLQRNRKAIEHWRKHAVEQLKQVRYFYKQAHWLLSRFPDGKLADVLGLVKLVDMQDIAAADWSLTPGRYVGVAPEEVDEDFDFEETLREIHIELKGLNEEAAELAAQIALNFEELGV